MHPRGWGRVNRTTRGVELMDRGRGLRECLCCHWWSLGVGGVWVGVRLVVIGRWDGSGWVLGGRGVLLGMGHVGRGLGYWCRMPRPVVLNRDSNQIGTGTADGYGSLVAGRGVRVLAYLSDWATHRHTGTSRVIRVFLGVLDVADHGLLVRYIDVEVCPGVAGVSDYLGVTRSDGWGIGV